MTPQELKNSVLQRAIQGKLVEQRPEEGTGEELYQTIQAEKRRLIKSGELKKEKSLPKITDDEIPFDIPDNWIWVRWGDLSESIQYGYNAPAQETAKIRMVRISDIQDGNVLWDTVPYCDIADEDIETYRLKPNDILFARTGGTVGKSYLVKQIPYQAIYAGYLIRTRYSIHLCPEYLKCFMDSYLYWEQLRNGVIATAQPNCNGKTLSRMILPLPPFAEQRRIVAKIEELLPYIDRYTVAWNRLEDFNKRFPSDMRKSLLQMAIQGKLVEQRSDEGTGEELYRVIQAEKRRKIKAGELKREKPLPEIAEDEIPFEIPDSWKWVRFGQIIDVRDGTHGTPTYVQNGVPLVTSKNLIEGRIDFQTAKMISERDADEINARSYVESGDILFAMIGTIGNPVLVEKDRKFCIKNMALFKPVNQGLFDMRYLLLFLQNEQYVMKRNASGGVQSFVSLRYLRN